MSVNFRGRHISVGIFRLFLTRYFGICQFILRHCARYWVPPMSPSKRFSLNWEQWTWLKHIKSDRAGLLKNYAKTKSKLKWYIPYVENTHVQFEIRLLLFDSHHSKKKEKDTELINANQKPSKSDNLKCNKWLRKRAKKKKTGKTIPTRSVRWHRVQLSDWFTWTKR